MPETALERFNARQTERTALTEQFLADARRRAAAFGKSEPCRAGGHGECTGAAPHRDADCLCECHDPEPTYWAWWWRDSGQLQIVGLCSGCYATAEEAMLEGFGVAPLDEEARSGDYFEQVTLERWRELSDWDAKTGAEKRELWPAWPEPAPAT